MSIESPQQLIFLREVGRICHLALREMAGKVRPGISTEELANVGARMMRENGARSAPALVYGFPGEICISVNEEAVHGIPGARKLEPGDLVKLDVTFEKNGYMGEKGIKLNSTKALQRLTPRYAAHRMGKSNAGCDPCLACRPAGRRQPKSEE
jgi:methionyl aminopeptidase